MALDRSLKQAAMFLTFGHPADGLSFWAHAEHFMFRLVAKSAGEPTQPPYGLSAVFLEIRNSLSGTAGKPTGLFAEQRKGLD